MHYFTSFHQCLDFVFDAPHLRTDILVVTHHLLQNYVTVHIIGREITDEEGITSTSLSKLHIPSSKLHTQTHIHTQTQFRTLSLSLSPWTYGTIKQVQMT